MNTAKKIPFNPGAPRPLQFQTATVRGFLPADRNKRVIAFIIDSVIFGVLGQIVISFAVIPIFGRGGIYSELMQTWAMLGVATFFWIWLVKRSGATPGKKMMGLRVVNEDHSLELTYGRLFIREFIGRPISGLVLLLGYLWVSFNKDRKTWHDIMAKTRVVDYR